MNKKILIYDSELKKINIKKERGRKKKNNNKI